MTEKFQSLHLPFIEMKNSTLTLSQNHASTGTMDHYIFDSTQNHETLLSSNQFFIDHHHQSQLPINFMGDYGQEEKKEVIVESPKTNQSPFRLSTTGFAANIDKVKSKDLSGTKRKRKHEGDLAKLKDVIHVRAKRGQATDSHSLAERLRREKINEKLKCLQDLVPGCYKTMGMAVMLDVIIDYIRSLQNQIEFLSMKLSAASMYDDLNMLEMGFVENLQVPNGYETVEMERIMRDGYEIGGSSCFNPTTWPF